MIMNKLKWISLGIGFAAGALVATLVSGRPSFIRTGVTAVLGKGLTAKRSVESLLEVGKENLTDLVAEADQKAKDSQAAESSVKGE
jgi:hypothetical protein